MKWISVEDMLPETSEDKYGRLVSKKVHLLVDGCNEWQTGFLMSQKTLIIHFGPFTDSMETSR
jgi:hypothetical protein